MSNDITYCPKCASAVDVLGPDIEDRYVCECPECGIVEVVWYSYDDPDLKWLAQVKRRGADE